MKIEFIYDMYQEIELCWFYLFFFRLLDKNYLKKDCTLTFGEEFLFIWDLVHLSAIFYIFICT